MTKKKYNSIRAVAILVFGVFMLGNGILLLFLAVYIPKSQEKHCTDYVIGEVVKVDGDSLRIRYELPGEGEVWNVSRSGAGWEKGDEVRVYYNPDDLSEKYIEGFDEGISRKEIAIGLMGIGIGIVALIVGRAAKKNERINNLIDHVDHN